ncbi:MAG: hypothetical protein QXV52_06000 [Nitrososphaeria archaeon]
MKDKKKHTMSSCFKLLVDRVKNYVIKNLGAPFILIFDALILLVAFMVIYEDTSANDLAVLAYCFLVVGFILQAISCVIYK